MIKVISLGGSIVVPDRIDIKFLQNFYNLVKNYLGRDSSRKLILVVGGGASARIYQDSYRKIVANPEAASQDWIGIAATRLNGELLKAVFSEFCSEPLVTDPTAVESFDSRILVAAGWKPGFSTDYDAVLLAEKFGAETVINLSNISKVYSDDPRINPAAVPMDEMTWAEFIKLVGSEWIPGKNVPFDPVATARAAELKMQVIVAGGLDLENIENLLEGRTDSFEGTLIGPE